ncbi:MAG: hypothetical protein IT452_21210 [Planctomycetia bacterium]|nr:hypothetical protein [Planctomycetia bacterium]
MKTRSLLPVLLGAALAAIAAASWTSPARAEDKKLDEKDKKKAEKEREAERKREEEKKKEEEARKRAEADWDRPGAGNPGWPEPPDTEEMFEAAKRHEGGAPAAGREEEPKPGVGGYRKSPSADEAEAAAAAGGAFGEGAREDRNGKKEEHK